MRRIAYVIATTCIALLLLGTVLRFLHAPGAGLLTVLTVGTFAGLALPANLFGGLREPKSKRRWILEIVGTLLAMHVVIYLLFTVQNWAGAEMFLFQGGILLIVFLVLVALASKNPDEPLKPFSKFNVAVILFCALLGISFLATNDKNGQRDQLVQLNELQARKSDSLRKVVGLEFFDLLADTANYDSSLLDRAYNLQMESQRVLGYIESVQHDFASQNSYDPIADTSITLEYPMDIDITTFYFIGEDIQNPTGKAVELYAVMKDYRDNFLHADVPFFIRGGSTSEEATQWVKDNFYHATAIEVMTRLELLKENIYQAMQYAIEHDLYK